MKSVRALCGMCVVCQGRRVGRVAQARLSGDLKRMEGLWMDAGLFGARYIPAEHIALIGDVAVIADSRGTRGRVRQPPLFLRAVTTDGRRVGAIVGAMVDEMTFSVERLVLSRGFWDDMGTGRANVRRYSVREESGDVVVELDERCSGEGDEACGEDDSRVL